MYIVTGGAGFIGSAVAAKLNAEGHTDIIIVDELGDSEKWMNLRKRSYLSYVHKDDFLKAVLNDPVSKEIKAIIHLGACSSTTERNVDFLMRNNFEYSKCLARFAVENNIRFIYASSAATYGDGSAGYSDQETDLGKFLPLNPYGYSKHLFDQWVIKEKLESKVTGIKFFNVYGPNEYHKEDMRSMVHKAWQQVKKDGLVSLFKSYKAEYSDGGQMRDFIYVKDCMNVVMWLVENPAVNGLFNLGTGQARTWNDLATSVFKALNKTPKIHYIAMPDSIKGQYQYHTEADMTKLRDAGYTQDFFSVEKGVADYIENYLETKDIYI